jgi:hypothetical protein
MHAYAARAGGSGGLSGTMTEVSRPLPSEAVPRGASGSDVAGTR